MNSINKISREEFERFVKKFPYIHGIKAIVDSFEIEETDLSWICVYYLRGGFTTSIEVIEKTVYKSEQPYCNLDDIKY